MSGHLIGTRIREARRKLGLTQRHVAASAGLSASYLNLIEHNRRGIAGMRLQALARVLNIAPASLTEGPERALLSELQTVATNSAADYGAVDAFVAQFPIWAGALAAISRQNRDLREALGVLTDRLNHDPFLAETLHAVLSNVTAIRSTAGILSTVDDIAPDRQRRFVRIIHDESRRLSDAATALSAYLDRASESKAAAATPEEALDRFMERHDFAFDALDRGQSTLEALNDAPELDSAAAKTLASRILNLYATDAQALPLEPFLEAAKACAYDPFTLQLQFGATALQIFRRLAGLRRNGIDAPRFGLLIVNAAGQALWRKPLPEFVLPRHGSACTLWPLFQAFSQPNRPSLSVLDMPDGAEIYALSIAEPVAAATLSATPDYQAAMLLVPAESQPALKPWLPQPSARRAVGTACAICPRHSCTARSGAAFLAQTASPKP